jgi:hypothetical protein
MTRGISGTTWVKIDRSSRETMMAGKSNDWGHRSKAGRLLFPATMRYKYLNFIIHLDKPIAS